MISAIASRWNSFWYSEYSPKILGVFRILFCMTLFARLTHYFDFDQPFLWEVSRERYYFGTRFFVSYFDWLQPPSYATYTLLMKLRLVALVCAGIGLFTRFAFLILFFNLTYVFFLNEFHYQNHVYFFILATFLCVFMPLGKSLSVDSFLTRFKKKNDSLKVSFWAVRLAQLTVSLVYLFSALQKLNHGWLSGEIVSRLLASNYIRWPSLFSFLESAPATYLALAVVLTEFFLVFGFWNRRTRVFAFIAGVGLHLSMTMTMRIDTFSHQMICMYLLFLKPDGVGKLVVMASAKWLNLFKCLDWTGRFSWNPHASENKKPHLVDSRGKMSSNGMVWVMLFGQILILSPFAWILLFLCKR